MGEDAVESTSPPKEAVLRCAHCGADNPPGLLLCLACGREPSTGRDLFAAPEISVPGTLPPSAPGFSHPDLIVTLPEPIEVPDPLPIPTLEDFAALPPQPQPAPPPIFRSPPGRPKTMRPWLSPVLRWIVGLLGVSALVVLGVGVAGSLATFNLPNSLCLGSLWLATAVVGAALFFARRGESHNRTTGAYRRLITSLGGRWFEITPRAAREQRARLPSKELPAFLQPASHLVYLAGAGDRTGQLVQLLLGTLCALVAGGQIEVATQVYDVLTASPLRETIKTIKRTAISQRILYVGAGYLEGLIMKQLSQSPANSAGDVIRAVLRQAGGDLLNQVAARASEVSSAPVEGGTDLDAQLAALRAYCEEFRALNPELYEQLRQEVEQAVHEFTRTRKRRVAA